MDEGLQEISDSDAAQTVSYVLKQDRKVLQSLQAYDDEGHLSAARRIVEHLKLSGVRFFRRPPDLSSRWPASTGTKPEKQEVD